MCGFCGVIGPASRAGADDVAAMNETLSHRGPDDAGVWYAQFPVAAEAFEVALGHRRLSIIDLSPSGHQPMQAHDGALTIAFNGEIYNYRELRRELMGLGACFRSESDTEVILEAYRAWGLGCLPRLNGMFAFALFDARTPKLVLARDPIGIKPLYYRFRDGVLTFGSELRALRCHRAFIPRISRGALGRFLRHGFVPGPESIYEDTWKLQPGDHLVWDPRGVEVGTYWRLTDTHEIRVPATFDGVVDEVDRLLGDAVEHQMISDVPLGAFLSGGIDSSAVVALMKERSRAPVRTFSIAFDDPAYDESGYARAVAEHLGTEHTELRVTRREALEVAWQLPAIYDEPFADASALPTALLSRLTRKHVTVALSGDGGDELFGGYNHYRRFATLGPLLRLPAPLRGWLHRVAPHVPHSALRSGLGHLHSRDGAELACRLMSEFEAEDLALVTGDDGARPSREQLEIFRRATTNDEVRRAMFADARVFLPDDILVKVDRASMAVALETRVPILDYRLVHFALALPLEMIWRAGQAKAPLREVLFRRVPASMFERPKHGFGMPIHSLLSDTLTRWKGTYLAPDRIRSEGHLTVEGVEALLAAGGRRPTGRSRAEALWRLLCFQRWFAKTHLGEPLSD